MNETFNPSLIISLGPSGRKALDFSKKLLSYLPKFFLDVIDYYDIGKLEDMVSDIQEIIDSKLLSVKYLNKLVDIGYKVRNESISSVKINLYLFWDVYSCRHSACDVVKALTQLSFGNIDKDQHSGVSLYIMPLMEKEWLLEETETLNSIDKLKQIINFVSEKENMLNLDSKVYVLHCISNDGTRIPMTELEYIAGIITYLNVLPSEDPPLSHYNRRLLKDEGNYKVGTIGITSLTVFKDKLLEDFSRYMAIDLLKYASQYDSGENFSNNTAFYLMNYDTQKKVLSRNVNIVEEKGYYKLSDIEKFRVVLPKEVSSYPKVYKNWEEFLESQCLTEMKEIIDGNSKAYSVEIKEKIEEDLKHITLNYSLKEAVEYLNKLKEETSKVKPNNKSSIDIDTSTLSKELKSKVDNYPNLIGYMIKCIILSVFFLYSMINLVFPVLSPILSLLIFAVFYGLFFIVACLDYWSMQKQLQAILKKYKEVIFKRNGSLVNLYIEKVISNNQRIIKEYLAERVRVLENCIRRCEEVSKEIVPKAEKDEEERIGNLITNLLDFKDRQGFYKEKAPRAFDIYRKFLAEIVDFEEFQKDSLKERLLEFSSKNSPTYVELDFFEYMKFKYKEKVNEELSRWIEKGIVKSKYLLQYVDNDLIEEHSLFITSPEIYRVTKSMKLNNLTGFEVSVTEGRDVYTNCISLVRLCLGVDFEGITPVKKLMNLNRKDESKETDSVTGGDIGA